MPYVTSTLFVQSQTSSHFLTKNYAQQLASPPAKWKSQLGHCTYIDDCSMLRLWIYAFKSIRTYIHIYIYILVDGLNLRKNISQMGLLFPIFGKIIQMFQTTNQYIYIYIYCMQKLYKHNQTYLSNAWWLELRGYPCRQLNVTRCH